MTRLQKISLAVLGTAAVSYVTYRIIVNRKLKGGNANATLDVQKELLIQNLIILKSEPDTESNRNRYRSKTIQQLQEEISLLETTPSAETSNLLPADFYSIDQVYYTEGLDAAIGMLTEEEIEAYLYGY